MITSLLLLYFATVTFNFFYIQQSVGSLNNETGISESVAHSALYATALGFFIAGVETNE